MVKVSGADIAEGADDARMQGGQIHGGEGRQVASFDGGAVDVGVESRDAVPDQELLGRFGIMGETVDQGLDHVTVTDPDTFVVVDGNLDALEIVVIPLFLQLIPPHVGLVHQGVIGGAFAQKVGPGEVGMDEIEVDGVVGGDPVEAVEIDHLFEGDHLFRVRRHIKVELAQIDVHPVDDPVNKFFNLFHNVSFLSC